MSEDSSLIAGGFSESYVKIWSLKGEKLRSLKSNITPAKVNDYSDLNAQKERHGSSVKRLVGHSGPVYGLSFSHDNKYLLSCSEDKTGSSDRTSRLWDVQRGASVRVFAGHQGSVKAVAVSPDGKLMASAGEDKTVMLWDLGSGKRLKTMTGHTDFIYTLDFSSDGNVLVSGSADCTVRAWDVKQDTPYAISVQSVDGIDKNSSSSDSLSKRMKLDKDAKVNGKDKLSKKDDKKDGDENKKSVTESKDQLSSFATKQTPIYTVQFTKRNLCLAAGAFTPVRADI
ncbi:unnamed protein product [Umbelopsis sp. WA50703]